MKRVSLAATVLGFSALLYAQFGGSPEFRGDRALNKAREYMQQAKVNEAVIEFRNALNSDPGSADAHFGLGIALLQRADYRAAHHELIRARDRNPDLIAVRFQLAKLQLRTGDIRSAREEFEKLRRRDKDVKETHYLAAQIAIAENEPNKAIQELTALLNKDPQDAAVYAELGQVYLSTKDYVAAESAFRKALKLDPKFHRSRAGLTQVYVIRGNREKAEQELIDALNTDPKNEGLLHVMGGFYWSTRRLDDFEKLYLDFIQKRPDSLIAKKRLAHLYLIKRDYKQAKYYTDKILKSRSGDTNGHFLRGRFYMAEKNFFKAIENLEIVTRDAPRFAPGFFFLALSQLQADQVTNAKRNLTKASELSPYWTQPRLTLAQLHLAAGDYDFALEESERVLAAEPNNEAALLISGTGRLGKGEADKAFALFKMAQELNPRDPAPHVGIASVYLVKNQHAQAINEYEEALKRDPDRIDALSAITQLQLIHGNAEGAFDRTEQQLSKVKNQGLVYQLMGELKLAVKEYPQGIAYLEQAIGIDPKLSSAYFMIGDAYAAQQKLDPAIEQYEKIIKKNPRAIPALMIVGILHYLKKHREKGREYFQRILDIKKDFTPAANSLARIYIEDGGNLDIALTLAQKARQAAPGDPTILDTLGWIYYKKGAYVTAVALLKESTERLKNIHPGVLYHWALAYHKNGDQASPKEALNKAIANNKDFSEATEAKKILAEIDIKASNLNARYHQKEPVSDLTFTRDITESARDPKGDAYDRLIYTLPTNLGLSFRDDADALENEYLLVGLDSQPSSAFEVTRGTATVSQQLSERLADLALYPLFSDYNVPGSTSAALFERLAAASSTVPEPRTLFLFGIGLVCIAMWGKRRSQNKTVDGFQR